LYDPAATSILPGWIPENLVGDLAMNAGYFPHKNLAEPVVRRCTAFYYASISQIDHHVGRMIQVLKSKGLYESTLIVFTSDHGEYLGFHHMLLKGNHMYDPLTKVPLVIKLPGHGAGAGSASEALVNTIDIAPTILKNAGLPVPAAMKGQDLFNPAPSREVVFCETRQHVMARTRTRKLIYDSAAPARSLFFDLANDPLEMHNLFNEPARQGDIAALVRAVESWRPAKLAGVFLDENAPQIKRPNVPPHDTAHRDEIAAWYARQMQQWRAANGPG
jgi:arylsulfatase A-like enzyme